MTRCTRGLLLFQGESSPLESINTYGLLGHPLPLAHRLTDGSSVALPVAAFDERLLTAALQDPEKERTQVF